MKDTIEFYYEIWKDTNTFGRCTIFPLSLIVLPIVFFCFMGFKK